MKKLILIGALALLISACSKEESSESSELPEGKLEEITAAEASHSLGLIFGSQFRRDFQDIDMSQFQKGVKEALAKEQDQEVMSKANMTLQEFHMAKRRKTGAEATAKGEAFLAENGKRAGVTTTASGLQYEVLTEGNGDQPSGDNTVTVNYRGTLIDGTEFDSSYSRNEPATFQLDRVIPGWTEGVALMKVGAKYKFFIPSALAYGERGAGANIGPNEALIFEVELLKVEATKPAAEKQ